MRKADIRAMFLLMTCAVSAVVVICYDRYLHTVSVSPVAVVNEPAKAESPQLSASPEQADVTTRHAVAAFSPDTVSESTLRTLGISAYKVRNFVRYRQAGKQFRTLADIRNTYGWTDEDISLIAPYVRFPAPSSSSSRQTATRPPHESSWRANPPTYQSHDKSSSEGRIHKYSSYRQVDVNTADTTQLMMIPGIGSYYAQRIIHLRSRYGGIVDVSQLSAIPHFPADAMSWLVADTTHIEKINLSNPDFKQMARHPLIGYERTKSLTVFIRTHGPIRTISQLKGTGLFTPEEIEQLLPYLTIGH